MSKKIVIVEDDRNLSELFSHVLQGNGYRTTVAYNGTEALKKIKKELPDMVILDILLPDISGLEILRSLKIIKETKKIPVLMCTEKGLIGDVEQALHLGASGYIVKPVDLKRIVKKVSDILNH